MITGWSQFQNDYKITSMKGFLCFMTDYFPCGASKPNDSPVIANIWKGRNWGRDLGKVMSGLHKTYLARLRLRDLRAEM